MQKEWYIRRNDRKFGPFTACQMKELATSRKLKPNDFVAVGPKGKWSPASRVKGLVFAKASEQHKSDDTTSAETSHKSSDDSGELNDSILSWLGPAPNKPKPSIEQDSDIDARVSLSSNLQETHCGSTTTQSENSTNLLNFRYVILAGILFVVLTPVLLYLAFKTSESTSANQANEHRLSNSNSTLKESDSKISRESASDTAQEESADEDALEFVTHTPVKYLCKLDSGSKWVVLLSEPLSREELVRRFGPPLSEEKETYAPIPYEGPEGNLQIAFGSWLDYGEVELFSRDDNAEITHCRIEAKGGLESLLKQLQGVSSSTKVFRSKEAMANGTTADFKPVHESFPSDVTIYGKWAPVGSPSGCVFENLTIDENGRGSGTIKHSDQTSFVMMFFSFDEPRQPHVLKISTGEFDGEFQVDKEDRLRARGSVKFKNPISFNSETVHLDHILERAR